MEAVRGRANKEKTDLLVLTALAPSKGEDSRRKYSGSNNRQESWGLVFTHHGHPWLVMECVAPTPRGRAKKPPRPSSLASERGGSEDTAEKRGVVCLVVSKKLKA